MFRRTLLTTVLLLSQLLSKADEGMWLPSLLKTINADAMYSKGLKIPIDSLFSLNSSSIKDAIVQFGGGCTGEIIGKNGLLLTNYHCGYSQVVSHSSVKDNYLTNGFWAMSMNEELPCAGLTATFIVRMEDVTESIVPFVNDSLKEIEKTVMIKELSQVLVQKAIQELIMMQK
ncbi:MAG: S46 family peptidase [Bacteroidota bacterium]|nr:MAG: S46 family peptidase [Bacteroidota bacterium]